MAKVSVSERNKKREIAVQRKRYARAELKKVIADQTISFKEKKEAVLRLTKMDRDTSSVRLSRRCMSCARPRAVYRRFALCRMCLRKAAVSGLLPGVLKASW